MFIAVNCDPDNAILNTAAIEMLPLKYEVKEEMLFCHAPIAGLGPVFPDIL